MERGLCLSLMLALTVGGCSWEPLAEDQPEPVVVAAPSPGTTAAQRAPVRRLESQPLRRGDQAAAMAQRMIGTPYRWGGADLDGFDCSGLVQFSYAQAQLKVPRTTQAQRSFGRAVSRDALRRGDLVFFDIEGKANHVGLYLGDGQFVHAPSSGKRVQTESMRQDFYAQRFSGARRVPGADTPMD